MDRVIFVDDEENVLHGLKLMLHPMREKWEMAFAGNGEEALARMSEGKPFDVIVTDMHMPGMHGDELLAEVMKRYPGSVRLVLSGNLDTETLTKAGAVAHQIVAKPCDPHLMRILLTRAFALRGWLADCTLKDALLEMGALPSVPVVYWELHAEMTAPEPSIERVGKIIEKDPGLSAKVLQIANSSRHGGADRVSNISQAANLVGLDNLKSFVLMAGTFSEAAKEPLPSGFSLDIVWKHALSVAQHSRTIAEAEDANKKVVDDAYTAGLLHDIGLLILASKLTGELSRALTYAEENGVSLFEAEKSLFGATHAEIGGFLLELWGLPEPIVNAITYHYYPSGLPETRYATYEQEEGFSSVTAVHVANYFCSSNEFSDEAYAAVAVDSEYLEHLELSEKLGPWYDLCFLSE